MGYVFTYNDAGNYDQNRSNAELERENWLMHRMLKPVPGESFLDIGCGTGSGLLSMMETGVQLTGLDASQYMLDIASKKIGHHADLHRCTAEDILFDDNSFNYSSIVNTLEFVEEPVKALEEAFRVTKDRVFIGILNRYSFRTIKLRFKRIFVKNIYRDARFFTILEIKDMIHALAGDVPVSWRTVYRFPNPCARISQRFGPLHIACKYPFGAFTGIMVILTPRFRTRPLLLEKNRNPSGNTVTGLARTKTEAK